MEIIFNNYSSKKIVPPHAINSIEIHYKDTTLGVHLRNKVGKYDFAFKAQNYKQTLRDIRECFNERISALEFLKIFHAHRDCNQINTDGILNEDRDTFIWGKFASETRMLLGHFFNQINNHSEKDKAGFLNRKIDLIIPDWEIDFKNYIPQEELQ